MSSPCRDRVKLLCVGWLLFGAVACAGRSLRVCADPNNLPFSNQAGAGFENRLAELAAQDLGAKLEYVWWSERKSFLKNSLAAGRCDVVLGIASGVEAVLITKPYYRSTYVFLSRKDRSLDISSLADERLQKLRIGVHVVGDDYVPPAHALARRGLSANLVGFSLFGAYGEPNPPARIVEAVRKGDIDLAIVWGPFAGYFARSGSQVFNIEPVKPSAWMGIPFTYNISMAVRQDDVALRDELDAVLARECATIRKLLSDYAVPTVPEDNSTCDGSGQQVSVSSR